MSLTNKTFHILLLLSLFFQINSQNSKIKAKSLESFCDVNLYKIIIDVEIENPMKEYKNFYLNVTHENGLLFKCILDPDKSQIICLTNLESQMTFLDTIDPITLPYPFPHVDGIEWDYKTFVKIIYRRAIYLDEQCGTNVTKSSISKLKSSKWDLITKVNKVYDGQCLISETSDNFYSFQINLNIVGGKLQEALASDKKAEIKFLQNMTLPFYIGTLHQYIETMNMYYMHEYYKLAFCYPLEDITSSNYLNKNGIDFKCNIPISEQYVFNGPLKVFTFTDNIYAKVTTDNKDNTIDFISMYFSIENTGNLDSDDEDESGPEEKIENKNKNIYEENEEEEEEEDKKEEDKKEEEKKEKEKKEEEPKKNIEINEQIGDNDKDSKSSASSSKSKPTPSPSPSPSISSSKGNLKKSSSFSSSNNKKPSASSSKPKSSSASSASSSPSESFKLPISSPKSSSKLRNIEDSDHIEKKKDYLLLDNKKINFICPDTPVFEIANIKDGIVYKPILDDDEQYNIVLTGYLKNGYKASQKNNKLYPLDYVPDDIKFKISVINNLAEKISDKKNSLTCILHSGTLYDEDELTQINCYGKKSEQSDKLNMDLSIDWASKENKYLSNILVKWPKDITDIRSHSKKLYSYSIYALSINKDDYDCFDDKFYFYVDIIDLKAEPQIKFNITMLNPNIIAECKLYNSVSLKCFMDLKLKKIKKGTNIRLPLPGNYNISTSEGNYINFTVFNFIGEDDMEIADDGIITDQTCGNNVLIGAVQNIGYNYISALVIIICVFVIFGVVFLCITGCVAYEITHRGRKGKYHPHVDENPANNTTTVNPVNVTQNQQSVLPGQK